MKQGDIWLINLDPTIGAEIRKNRPGIIVNYDLVGRLPLKVIVPLTTWKKEHDLAPWMVKMMPNKQNNIVRVSTADCFQVRSVSDERFIEKIGAVNFKILELINEALANVFYISSS